MQDVVEGAIWHPVCDDDGVGGRRRLTCSQHRQDIWVGKYPGERRGGVEGQPRRHPEKVGDTTRMRCDRRNTWRLFQRNVDAQRTEGSQKSGSNKNLSLGYSSLKSRLFLVVQSRTFSILTTISFPCQRPCHSFQWDTHAEKNEVTQLYNQTHYPEQPTYLSRLVFIYPGQKRELLVVNPSVFVQSTISLKIKTKFSHITGMWSPYEAVYASATDSLGRVLVVPFQKVSLKGILVMLWPSFSAFSVSRKKKAMMNMNHQNCMLILTTSLEWYLWGFHAGEVCPCPGVFLHIYYRCSPGPR